MRAWQHSHTVYLNRGDFFFLSPAAVQMVNKILWANGMRPHNILGIVTVLLSTNNCYACQFVFLLFIHVHRQKFFCGIRFQFDSVKISCCSIQP